MSAPERAPRACSPKFPALPVATPACAGRVLSIAGVIGWWLVGCAAPVGGPGDGATGEPSRASTALTADDRDLSRGERSVLAEGIVGAENLLRTSDDRVLVSGDEGIFELAVDPDGQATVTTVATDAPCAFGGLAEHAGVVYANCYDFADSVLYASPLDAALAFAPIYQLPGVTLANGLAADGAGHLYVAATFHDQILRLEIDPDDALTIAGHGVWVQASGLTTNGLAIHDGVVYWTDGFFIKSASVQDDGGPTAPRVLAARFTFFDDLVADAEGLLVADYLGNAIRLYDLRGRWRAPTVHGVQTPSSVLRVDGWSGLGSGAVVVTERSPGRVLLIRQP